MGLDTEHGGLRGSSAERHAWGDAGAGRVVFARSLLPMVVVDDQRRYVDANQAACLLLRLGRDQVLKLRADDLTPPEQRPALQELWEALLRDGSQSGRYELLMPDGQRVQIIYSATANVEPQRHLAIMQLAAGESNDEAVAAQLSPPALRLTEREREVLALVAMGETGQTIGSALHISATTVETHVRNCLSKLAAKNRPHAIAIALEHGEITLE
jgi:PAS domain S-box-containing protein